MGECGTSRIKEVQDYQFKADFSKEFKPLFLHYQRVCNFLKATHFFQAQSKELHTLIDIFLQDPFHYDSNNEALQAIHSAFQIHHPLDPEFAVSHLWLLHACFKQHQFLESFPFQELTFQNSFKQYVQFVYLCSKFKEITVPARMGEFAWRAHILNKEAYIRDMIKMIGKVPPFQDIAPEVMTVRQQMTMSVRDKVLGGGGGSPKDLHYSGYGSIWYGGEVKGTGS